MLFPNLSDKIQDTFRRLRGKGKITEKDVDAALREVKLALLEADVNFKIVKSFLGNVRERSLGQEVLKSITPGQQVIKIVHDEMTKMMGGGKSDLILQGSPAVIMLAGLQGSGKTTTAAKLARYLKSHKPLLVAADIYRPAAIKQLQVLGASLDIPVFSMGEANPVDIAKGARERARKEGYGVIVIDTAGRLHIDDNMMQELERIKEAVTPSETILVVDAMTGQDAVNITREFNERLGITGVVLTKIDGDTRGGAALSIKGVAACPIKFVGLGEKTDAIEPFHPDRLAARILGMGDVLSLVEKAQSSIDAEKARELEMKMLSNEFSLSDFKEQLKQIKNMGPLDQIFDMLPGAGKLNKQFKGLSVDEKQLAKIEAIIDSMTGEERNNPEIINSSRRRRIALGSGTEVQDVNRLLKQFTQMKKMMKQFGSMKKGHTGMRFPF
ncbi:MAG TPA: signal recognition particle protein [Firmicutes bacterium]|nr:signal recognition particle protein [Bacillota bacterium]